MTALKTKQKQQTGFPHKVIQEEQEFKILPSTGIEDTTISPNRGDRK